MAGFGRGAEFPVARGSPARNGGSLERRPRGNAGDAAMIEYLRLTLLSDNYAAMPGLLPEHGLSRRGPRSFSK